jgi:nitrogen fixation protein FixH
MNTLVIQYNRTAQSTEMKDLLEVNLKATIETKPNKWKMASKNEPPMDAMEGKVTD